MLNYKIITAIEFFAKLPPVREESTINLKATKNSKYAKKHLVLHFNQLMEDYNCHLCKY